MQLTTQETAARGGKTLLWASLSALIVALMIVAAIFASLLVLGSIDSTPAFADEVPAAVAEAEVIDDADNPLGAFKHDALCNIHYIIYACTALTLVYGGTVVYRRLNDVKAYKEMDEAISRQTDAATAGSLEDYGTAGA